MTEWQKLVNKIAGELKCLPSVFADDNEHIVRKASELMEAIESYRSRAINAETAYLELNKKLSLAGDAINYPEAWDTACYDTLASAVEHLICCGEMAKPDPALDDDIEQVQCCHNSKTVKINLNDIPENLCIGSPEYGECLDRLVSKAESSETQAELTNEEIELIRQWFNTVQDLSHKDYLARKDFELAERIYKHLGRRAPNSVTGKLTNEPT